MCRLSGSSPGGRVDAPWLLAFLLERGLVLVGVEINVGVSALAACSLGSPIKGQPKGSGACAKRV